MGDAKRQADNHGNCFFEKWYLSGKIRGGENLVYFELDGEGLAWAIKMNELTYHQGDMAALADRLVKSSEYFPDTTLEIIGMVTTAIYDAMTVSEGVGRFKDWESNLISEIREAFHHLTRVVNNWMPEIMAYFEHPVTNAYTESLNGLIRVMNRLGRGYSFEALRRRSSSRKVSARPRNRSFSDRDTKKQWPPTNISARTPGWAHQQFPLSARLTMEPTYQHW